MTERGELTWLTNMWDLAPCQRKPLKNSPRIRRGGGGLNVWFEKFVGVQYLILRLGVENQITAIDESSGMDFFQQRSTDS
jgi:hypothetical protein